MATARTFGLLLKSELRHGTRYVSVELIAREEGREHPLGTGDNSWERPKHLANFYLDGLGLYGFVSEYKDQGYIGADVEYRNMHAVDAAKARRMLKTLTKINRVIDATRAYEPGDKLMALGKALKLDFVVERVDNKNRFGSFYSDSDWHFMSLEEGRNRYRTLIREEVAAQEASTPRQVAI